MTRARRRPPWRLGQQAVIVAGILATAGCASPPKEDRRGLTVGDHRLSVAVPPDWEVIDLGRLVVLRSGFGQIAFQDMGPLRGRDGDSLEPAAVASLGAVSLDSLTDAALARLGYDQRIEVERRRRIQIGGHPVTVLDTWYLVTHERYRRIALILNERSFLAVETRQGPWEVVSKRFDEVLATVKLAP